MTPDLPSGPRGRVLACGMAVAMLAVLWLGVAAPLLDWRADLSDQRQRREALAGRMAVVADSLPALRSVGLAAAETPPARAVIAGGTDAVAAAAVQEQVQDMARRTGISLASAEALPAEPVGRYRRIGLRVAVSGSLPVLVAFLEAIAQATPRMLVDDLQIQRSAVVFGGDKPLSISFAVFGFRAATP